MTTQITTDVIANNAVTDAKMAVGSANNLTGYDGSGVFSTVTVGSGLALSSGILSAPGGTGTVTTTGSPASGNLTKFSGSTSVTNADLTGDISTSGTTSTTLATVNTNVGSFTNANITVNGKGLITAAASGTSSLPAAIVSALPAAASLVLTVDFTTYQSYILTIIGAADAGGSANTYAIDVSSNGGSSYVTAARCGTRNGTYASNISAEMQCAGAPATAPLSLEGVISQPLTTGGSTLTYTSVPNNDGTGYCVNGISFYPVSAAINRIKITNVIGFGFTAGRVVLQPISFR